MEISLVAILDADKKGFLRSETSLIQTIGRAARNAEDMSHVCRCDPQIPCVVPMMRRFEGRELQEAYNKKHGITPEDDQKAVRDLISISKVAKTQKKLEKDMESMSRKELEELIGKVQKQMKAAAADLNFEMAAELRDQMIELKKNLEELDK